MAKTGTQRTTEWRHRKRARQLELRRDLFMDLWRAFEPGTFFVRVSHGLDADPDLQGPLPVDLKWPPAITAEIEAFAMDRGLTMEGLLNLMKAEIHSRMRKRGVTLDASQFAVE